MPTGFFDSLTPKQTFWNKLIQWIKKNSIVPVIGPDLLMFNVEGRQVNFYRFLAERLAAQHDIKLEDVPAQHPLSRIAVRIGRGNAETAIWSLLEEFDTPEMPVPEPLEKLARIKPLQLFVTTTFDPFLQKVIDRVRYNGEATTNTWRYAPDIDASDGQQDLPENQTSNSPRPDVFHLFGSASDGGSFVITEGDTVDFMAALLSREGRVPKELFKRLKSKNLLMLGTRFNNWLARFFVRLANDMPMSATRPGLEEWFADDEALRDKELHEFFEVFRKNRTSIYGAGSSEECPSCAVQFVNELYAQWETSQPRPVVNPASTRITASGLVHGAVFISYDRGVRRAVQNMSERMHAGGVHYWWDEKNIEPGDEWAVKIREGIEHASVFVPVISRGALNKSTGYVFKEWHMAKEVLEHRNPDRPFILPVIIDEDAKPPEMFGKFHIEEHLNGILSEAFVNNLAAIQRRFIDS